MMQIHRFIFNPIQENTYIVFDETKQCILIDCGNLTEQENLKIKYFIDQNQLKPVRLINTHLHFDHSFGNYYIYNIYDIKPEAHPNDEYLIDEMPKYAETFGLKICPKSQPLGSYLHEGDSIKFGNKNEFQVIHTPGHTPGGLCFYEPNAKVLFSGDSLFFGSIGRTDFPGGNTKDLVTNLRKKIMTLPNDTIIRPGHGESTSISYEKQYNKFI